MTNHKETSYSVATTHQDDDVVLCVPPSSEWNYVGEGGKHAVFHYTGKTQSFWMGKLLRIDKIWFRNLSRTEEYRYTSGIHNTNNYNNHHHSFLVSVSRDNDPYRNKIHQILFPYVDIPYMIHPPHSERTDHNPNHSIHTFLTSLRDHAIATQRIPSRRYHQDWLPSSTTTRSARSQKTTKTTFYEPPSHETSTTTTAAAPLESSNRTGMLLLPDYRILHTNHGQNYSNYNNNIISSHRPDHSMCIELKPKCGFTTTSPFVQSHHKYTTSRYTLQQQLYQSGQLTKDWMTAISPNVATNTNTSTMISSSWEVSRYDPLDLFSNNALRIRTALLHLMSNPQNNCKLWYHHQLLIGLGLETSNPSTTITNYMNHTSLDWKCLGESIGIAPPVTLDGRQEVLDFCIDVTTKVLMEDAFLNRLLLLQKLDLLDTDGAMAVYHRLIQLCDNNETMAESYVDTSIEWMDNVCPDTTESDTDTMHIPQLLKHSPIQLPKMHANIVQLCSEVDAVQSLLQTSHTMSSMSFLEDMNIIQRRAKTVIENFTIEECCYVLQLWLFSLSMCDVTFFIHFHFLPAPTNPDTGPDRNNHSSNTDPTRLRIKSLQSHADDTPGCIEFYNDTTNEYKYIQYQIKVIDIDRKPAHKIRSRYVKERQLDQVGDL